MSSLLIRSNAIRDDFIAGNYSLVGVKALCIIFDIQDREKIELHESALPEVYNLFEQLNKQLKCDIVLKSISIYWTHGSLSSQSLPLWTNILHEISILHTKPILFVQSNDSFPSNFNLNNISKLYFKGYGFDETLTLQTLQGSCLSDLGLIEISNREKVMWAHELVNYDKYYNKNDDDYFYRPIDSITLAQNIYKQGLLNVKVANVFNGDYSSDYSWYPEYAAEIRFNKDCIRDFNEVIWLLKKERERGVNAPLKPLSTKGGCNGAREVVTFQLATLWMMLPRDVCNLIISMLHPLQWKERYRVCPEYFARQAELQKWADEGVSHFKSFRDARRNFNYAREDYEEILKAPDDIRKRIVELEKELQELPAKIATHKSILDASEIEKDRHLHFPIKQPPRKGRDAPL
jgi:hypothetical protein